MLPTAGLRLQVTAVFELPVTVAVNCCVWPCPKLACAGLTLTVTGAGGGVLGAGGGVKISVAVALLELSATLVAVTVTVCCAAIDAGAV